MLEIRPFDPDHDYPALSEIENSVFTDEFFHADTFREDDQHRPAHIKHQRFVARLDGQVAGYAQYSQHAGQYHPQRFSLWVVTHADFLRRSVGTALWNTVLEAVQPHHPIALSTNAREDIYGLDFVKARGLIEKMRTWENRIVVGNFDPAPYDHLNEQLEQENIGLVSLEDFLQQPDAEQRFYQLHTATSRDVPRAFPSTERSFEDWAAWSLRSPKVLRAGTFFAMQDGKLIGLSQLFKSDGDYLTIGLTGVLAPYRGKQIALALKVACLKWAKKAGYKEVRTWNDSNNAPILALNQKLGFVRCPAWIECVKELE